MTARSLLLLALAGACTATMNMTNTTSSTFNETVAPATPVPAATTKFCETDAVCQEFGDASATCDAGACTCSAEFEDALCFAVNDTAAQETPVQVRVALVWENAVCTPEVAEQLVAISVARLAAAFPGQVPATAWACGSVHVTASYQVPAADAAALDLTAQVAEINTAAQAAVPAAGAATATATVATTAAALECPLKHAVETVLFAVSGPGVCRVLKCADGYVATAALDACVRDDVETTTADDDLSGGAVAGLVVGILVAVGAAAGVAYIVTRDAKPTEAAQAVNEPIADVEEPATAANEPVANPEEQ